MPIRTHRIMTFGIAVLAILGTLMLSLERATIVLPVVTLVVAFLSVYFVDIKNRFSLNRNVASALAIAGATVSLRNFLHFDRSQQLLSIADLLIYLQLVLLMQQKTTRIYWQLLTVSQLQVVVASALSITPLFGIFLGIYATIALVTLLLFFVYRETRQAPPPTDSVAGEGEAFHEMSRWSLQPQPMNWVSVSPLASQSRGASASDTGSLEITSGVLAVDQSRTATENWGALRVGPSLTLTVLVVTLLTFIAAPRKDRQPWQTPAAIAQRTVGFTPKVKLGQLGSVAHNPSTVMRIQFLDPETMEPIKLYDPPLLRGAVMTRYTHAQSRSATSQWSNIESYSSNRKDLPRSRPGEPYVIQRITLEALDEPVVFSIFPVLAIRDVDIKYNAIQSQLTRGEELRGKQINIELGTTGITGRRQDMLTPKRRRTNQRRLLHLPWSVEGEDPLAGMKQVGLEVIEEAGISLDDHHAIAKKLERFFQTDGGFEYSLQPIHRDPEMDPVEDFIVQHRQGHCEYFASALALMLRSRGIPSRVIIGFRGGEWNDVGKYYQVRQLHAHTWVEAYLSHDQLEKAHLARPDTFPLGGWLILDGTAEASLPSDPEGAMASLTDYVDYAKLLWTNYIVGMSRYKQDQSIYNPIISVYQAARKAAVDAFSSGRPLMFIETASNGIWVWLHGNWFSWRGGLAGSLFCLFLYCVYVVGRWGQRLASHYLRRSRAARYQRRGRVRFYNRLEKLLRRHGIRRSDGQTPRELAGSAAGHLAESPRTAQVSALPGQVVDAYYQVRFGNRPLDNQELESVEQALFHLESALTRRR